MPFSGATQHIRRTRLIHKADRSQANTKRWDNVFQFNDEPFKIQLTKTDLKVEVTAYHQVPGIRMRKICSGFYQGDKRGDINVRMGSHYTDQDLQAGAPQAYVGLVRLHVDVGRYATDESDDEEDGCLSVWCPILKDSGIIDSAEMLSGNRIRF